MLLLSTSSLKWYWIHKIFILAKKSNYNWLDLVIDKTNYDSLDEIYLKWLSDAFNIPILSITAPDRWLDKTKIDKIIKIAETLKSQVINFSPPHLWDKNSDWYLKYLPKMKKEHKISIAIQNVEQKFMLFIIPEYKNNNLQDIKKITWDTTLNIESIDKSSWTDLMKMQASLWNSIVNVFVSDRELIKWWLLPWNAWGWVSYLPIESFFMKLKISWYNWFFTLKVKPSELWAWNDEKVIFNLNQFQGYYEKHFLNYKI